MAESETLRCDFCGRRASHVRRVALDRGYDRLALRHTVRYACRECSGKKEELRTRALDSRPKPL